MCVRVEGRSHETDHVLGAVPGGWIGAAGWLSRVRRPSRPGARGRRESRQKLQPLKFRTTATIKDLMDSVVDPSSDYLWESVATIVTKKGT